MRSSTKQASPEIRPGCSERGLEKSPRMESDCTTAVGKLFHCLTVPVVENECVCGGSFLFIYFFTSSLNLSFQFIPVVSCSPTVHHSRILAPFTLLYLNSQ